MRALVVARLRKHREKSIREFEKGIKSVRGVRACYHVTGRFDMVVELALRDLDHLGRLIRVDIARIPGVMNLETMLVMPSPSPRTAGPTSPNVARGASPRRCPVQEVHPMPAKKGLFDLHEMKRAGEQIAWLTAYDYPTASFEEAAGVDMILVGDSLGMCVYGYPGTVPVTMDQCIVHSEAVRRGAPDTFVVGDMPLGSYQASDEDAVTNAIRFLKEANVDAIKLEGGVRTVSRVRAILDAGVAVCGQSGSRRSPPASSAATRPRGAPWRARSWWSRTPARSTRPA